MNWKKATAIICAILCGAVFILSATTKIMPIEGFEISLVDIGVANWHTTPIIARLIIGMEFALGFMLIFLFKLRRFTVPFAAALLVAFTIYLVALIATYGNKGSCGCFGSVIEVTPFEGIVKNIGLLLLLIPVYAWASPFHFRFKNVLAVIGIIILWVLPFIVNPMGYPFAPKPFNEFERFALDSTLVYQTAVPQLNMPQVTKGKLVVAILSSSCPHCRLAGKKLAVMKKQSPDFPLVFILNNGKQTLPAFFEETKSENVPHILVDSKDDFLLLSRGVFPKIFWVNNDTVEYETNYYELDQKAINDWLKK